MKSKSLLLLAVLCSSQAFAQNYMEATLDTVTDWSKPVIDYTAKHFSASYHGEFYGVRRDVDSDNSDNKKIGDLKFMHNPTLVYKPTDNWSAMATAEFKFSDQPNESAGASYPNGFYRGLVTLTRKKVLDEKENGIQLDLGIGRRQFNTGADQAVDGKFALPSYGNNRVFATLSKKTGPLSNSLFIQYLQNDYKKTVASTWRQGIEVIPTITAQITDRLSYFFNDDIVMNQAKADSAQRKIAVTHEMNIGYLTYTINDSFSTYYQLKYLHTEGFTTKFASQDDWMEHYTGVTYSINAKNSVTFEVGSELAHARDGRDGFSKRIAYPELALYLDFAI